MSLVFPVTLPLPQALITERAEMEAVLKRERAAAAEGLQEDRVALEEAMVQEYEKITTALKAAEVALQDGAHSEEHRSIDAVLHERWRQASVKRP